MGSRPNLTSDADGRAFLSLEPGEYYIRELKSPYGYLLEPARILFTVKNGIIVKVEVTNQRDTSISMSDSTINLPKTGEDYPTLNYVLVVPLLGFAIVCGVGVFQKERIVQSKQVDRDPAPISGGGVSHNKCINIRSVN